MTEAQTVTFNAHGKKGKENAYTLNIRLDAIKVMGGFNPRGPAHEKEIETLADSIAKNGLIHPPTVRPTKTKGEYELISGHRRYLALKTLGREDALFVVRLDLGEDMEAKAYAVAENSPDGRTDLTYVELGRTFTEFTKAGWGPQKIATKAGIHVATVRRALKLMECPADVLELVDRRILSESAALVYAKLEPAVQNLIPQDKLEGASAHYIKVLATEAQKQLAKASGEAGAGESDGEAAASGGKEKGKSKVNWRSPKERTEVIRELAHIAYNPKNDGAEVARQYLTVLYWIRGHGKQIGDLKKADMDALIKGDNEAFNKAAKYAEEKAAKDREKAAAKEAKSKEGKK